MTDIQKEETYQNTADINQLIKLAESGVPSAQFNLGVCYANGRGVAQDYAKAVEWYTKAAGQGNPKAQYGLGGCYFIGQGVERNTEKAKQLWKKAAAQGMQFAKDALKEFFKIII